MLRLEHPLHSEREKKQWTIDGVTCLVNRGRRRAMKMSGDKLMTATLRNETLM